VKLLPYIGRRIAFFLPQVLGIVVITFIIVRMIPGDPARLMAGPLVPEEGVELIRQKMGLSGPLPLQFLYYVKNIAQGNLGFSWYTGNPVATDIAMKLPATLELLILAIAATFFILFPLSIKAASMGRGWMQKLSRRIFFFYGMAAGAFPDFWLGLILIFIFYAILGWTPTPTGQLDIGLTMPTRITGMIPIDSLVTGNWTVFKSSLAHLVLPVFVLTFVYGSAVSKVAIVTASQLRKSAFVNFANVCGLPVHMIDRYITKSIYPPVATITAVTFAFLLGGAVLVETVFSWGGFGQYAVQSVVNADFAAIQGVVLVSAIINLIIYIIVDVVYFLVDPRIRSLG